MALTNNEKTEFQNSVGTRLSKDWKNYCLFKINYYTALTNYFGALSSAEQEKYGESIGYIQYAELKLSECVKMKNVFKEFQETLKYTVDYIDVKSKLLKKDNDFVYNQKIIANNDLTEIKGVSLVKCLPIDFINDPEVVSQDIFVRLVSIKAHELSSLYSEDKAKLLRQIISQVDDKNAQLNQFMSALQINQLHLDNFDYLKLPKQLLECCASISVKPNLLKEDLPKAMKSIVNVSVQAKEILDEIEEIIEIEEKEHREEKLQNGETDDDSLSESDSDSETDTKQSERSLKLKEISKQYDILLTNFNEANASNTSLHDAFSSIIKNLQVLSLPLNELSDKLPLIEQINDEESKQIRDKLISLLAKVEEMKAQREQLYKRFQAAILEDDITKLIASKQNDIQNTAEFFKEQLKKHDQLVVYLQQNLQAQDNILRALADSNASFASDRKKILEATQQRNAFIDSLVLSYQSINELIDKSNKGVSFFQNLNKPLNDLLKNVKDFCTKSKQERENKKKITSKFNYVPTQPIQQPQALPVFNRYRPKPPAQSNSQPSQLPDDLDRMNLNSVNERPKLKDFLPFMKPQSWGNNTNKSAGPPTIDRKMPQNNQLNINQSPQQMNIQVPMSQNDFSNQIPQQVNPMNNQQMPLNQPKSPQQIPLNNNYPGQNQYLPSVQEPIQPNQNEMKQQPQQMPTQPQFNQIQKPTLMNPTQMNQYYQQKQQQVPLPSQGIPQQGYNAQTNHNVMNQLPQNNFPNQGMMNSQQTYNGQMPQNTVPNQQILYQNQLMYQQQQQQQIKLEQQKKEQEELYQQKIFEQKLLEQQLKEKEIQLKKQELEQREQQFKLHQHQFFLQQQHQQQQQQQNYVGSQQPIPNPISQMSNMIQQQNTTSYTPAQQQTTQVDLPKDTKGVLENIKPESVYKPGYFNQINENLTRNILQPVNTGLPSTVPSTSMIQPNLFIAPVGNFPAQISMTYSPTQMYKQQPHQINPNLTHQPNNQYNSQQQFVENVIKKNQNIKNDNKISAIDDLLDLFDGKNAQIYYPTLQPSITNNQIEKPVENVAVVQIETAKQIEESTLKPVEPTVKNDQLPKEDLKQISVSLSNSSLNSNISSPTTSNTTSNKKLNFLNNPAKLDRFANEVNKFENHVNSLSKKTLSNATIIEKEWKELNDYQEKSSSGYTISVARCYPNKNRYPDLLPYDQTRVCLQSKNGDDYINASIIGQLTSDIDSSNPTIHNPNFIISQAPLASSSSDLFNFWSMIIEQQVELVVCLCRDSELAYGTNNGIQYYWPVDKQTPLNINSIKISLLSFKETAHTIQRICTVKNSFDNQSRTVVLLQHINQINNSNKSLVSATGIGLNEMPENIASFLKFIKECESFYKTQQRSLTHPVLVHCMNGVSRSAVFILLYSIIQVIDLNCDYNQPMSTYSTLIMSDLLIRFIKQMRTKRKYMIQSMCHLKYSYEATLYYLKDILIKEGVLNNFSFSSNEAFNSLTSNNVINSEIGTRKQSVDSNIINDESLVSIQSSNEQLKTNDSDLNTSNDSNEKSPKKITNLADLCDPDKFTIVLDDDSTKKKQKFTKKDFLSSSTSSIDPLKYDPFRSLDPLAKN